MKKHIITGIFATVLLALAALSSCKPEKIIDPEKPVVKDKGLTVELSPLFDGVKMNFNDQEYTRGNGEKISIQVWSIILSHLSLVKSDNTEVLLGDGYMHVSFENKKTKLNFPTIPAGTYKGVKFMIGVDSAINHQDPSVWPAGHPLNPNVNFMHWGWAGGYIFHQMDGKYRGMGSSTLKGFTYHQATNAMTKRISILNDFTISDVNALTTLTIGADAKYYFDGPPNQIEIASEPASHSNGASEVATMNKLKANQDKEFSIISVK